MKFYAIARILRFNLYRARTVGRSVAPQSAALRRTRAQWRIKTHRLTSNRRAWCHIGSCARSCDAPTSNGAVCARCQRARRASHRRHLGVRALANSAQHIRGVARVQPMARTPAIARRCAAREIEKSDALYQFALGRAARRNAKRARFDLRYRRRLAGGARQTTEPHPRRRRTLCQSADATIVVSQRLRELKTTLAKRVELVPNGVDVEHYQRAVAADEPVHPLARAWRKPVLGYLGSIHAERVDLLLN